MARNFNGSSHYIEAASAVVSAEPLTMACWKKPASTVASALMSVGTSSASDRWQLAHGSFGAECSAASVSGTSAQSNIGSVTSGAWVHCAGVFASSTSRTAYANGIAGAAETTAKTLTGLSRTVIGARMASSYGAFFSGDIARAAVWNAALTAREIASLAKGFCPCMIRPQSLVFFVPLLGAAADLRGGLTLTDTGTTAAEHPRIILPS